MAREKWRIGDLPRLASALREGDKQVLERIYDITESEGRIRLPPTMRPWLEERFGDIGEVELQRVIRVTNRVTLEEALFNPLRANRPVEVGSAYVAVEFDEDMLRDPLVWTPEDEFGRIRGEYCISASNVAKYEGLHGVVVFDEPDPLRFNREQVSDYIDTGLAWAEKARSIDPEARYFFFMWNCGERAGASLPHGHAQVLAGRHMHYSRIEHLRRCAISYRQCYQANYFDDLYRVHSWLTCGFDKEGVMVLAHLTPVKEKEVVLMGGDLDQSFKDRVYEVLACFRDDMGVNSFNLALVMPPSEGVVEDWTGYPVIARLVDRGETETAPSDMGTMELYAASVVSSDPFEVARVVRRALTG
jgi:hypothetical protein